MTFNQLIHKLVGTSGTYGLTEIYLAAEALEKAGHEKDFVGAQRFLERLKTAVERAIAWYKDEGRSRNIE